MSNNQEYLDTELKKQQRLTNQGVGKIIIPTNELDKAVDALKQLGINIISQEVTDRDPAIGWYPVQHISKWDILHAIDRLQEYSSMVINLSKTNEEIFKKILEESETTEDEYSKAIATSLFEDNNYFNEVFNDTLQETIKCDIISAFAIEDESEDM